MVWGHPPLSTYPALAGWWEHWEHRSQKPLDRNHRRNPWFPIGSPIGRSLSQSIDPWISIKERLICEPIIQWFTIFETKNHFLIGGLKHVFDVSMILGMENHPNWLSLTHQPSFFRLGFETQNHQPAIHGGFPRNGRRLRLKSGQICGGCRERRCWLQRRCRALTLTHDATRAMDGIAMGCHGWPLHSDGHSRILNLEVPYIYTYYIYIHKAIFWGYSLTFRPYINLIYGIGSSNESEPEMAIDSQWFRFRWIRWLIGIDEGDDITNYTIYIYFFGIDWGIWLV